MSRRRPWSARAVRVASVVCLIVSGCAEEQRPTGPTLIRPLRPPTPVRVGFTVGPKTTVAGVTMATVVAAVLDSAGLVITTATHPITLTLGPAGWGGMLTGTKVVAAESGFARFTDLRINQARPVDPHAKPPVGYVLTASALGLERGTSGVFGITPGPPERLWMYKPPTVPAGAPFYTWVDVTDSVGNWLVWPGDVTLALDNDTTGAVLSGTLTQAFDGEGSAFFAPLALDRPGTYTLVARAAGLAPARQQVIIRP